MEAMVGVFGGVAFFAAAAFIINLALRHRRQLKIAAMQVELHGKMMDRFESSEEILRYLGTDPGRNLIQSSIIERRSPHGRILGAIQAGIVLAATGIAFLALRDVIKDGFEALSFLGTLALAIGLAFLLSAGASYFLSKKWHLINGQDKGGEESGEG